MVIVGRDDGVTGSYTRRLSEFCSSLNYESIPPRIIHRAKWAVLDTLGIILGASATLEGKRIANFVRELRDKKEATAIGFAFKSSVRNVAFLNGTLSEMLELQDGYSKGGIHPCCGVISSTLAMAEYHHRGGKELLTSIIVGYEVANRVSEAIHPSHLGRGFQPTGTVGAIGGAAATGKLIGFDKNQMFNSIGIAGYILPISTGDNLYGGYSIKPVHGGAAARAGIESAMLAKIGLTACSLEGTTGLNKGFCAIVSDKPNYGKITEGLGEKYTIEEVYIKPYACCRINHPAVEIVLDLLARHQFKPEDIEDILIKTYTFAASVPGQIRPNPSSYFIHGQFSMPYCVAVALIDGQVGLEQFNPEKIKDQRIHQLADRIKVLADIEMDRLRPANRPALVEINLKSGQKLTGRVDYPKGDSRKPLSEEEMLKKFEDLASHTLSLKRVKKVGSLVLDLEKINDVREMVKKCFEKK